MGYFDQGGGEEVLIVEGRGHQPLDTTSRLWNHAGGQNLPGDSGFLRLMPERVVNYPALNRTVSTAIVIAWSC